MAEFILSGASVTFNSIALSDHVKTVTLNVASDAPDVTAMGDDLRDFLAMNATDKVWRATRIHSSDARPSGAQNWTVASSLFGSGAARSTEAYVIFVLKGANLGAGKALTASWNTSPATSLTGIFRPLVGSNPGSLTERMTIKKVNVNTSGGMTLSVQAGDLTSNLANTNGLNVYVAPI